MLYSSENFKNAKNTDVFEFVCKHCGKTFYKTKREISKNKGVVPSFCSVDCAAKERTKQKTIVVICAQCGKEKRIELSDYNNSETKNFFCNSSCAAKYNNHVHPKRQKVISKKEVCSICGGKKSSKSKICKKCYDKKRIKVPDKTLGDYVGYDGTEKYLTIKCQSIRKDAKRVLSESSVEKVCCYCKNHEFDSILEVHHIKSVLEFDRNVKISEINALKNLVWLCPNHHTMLEKGLINL